ncbi:transcriptional regulator, PadR family [Rathayibacter oskolensis]|uniref:Transcriptional regulator, PadR family n=1 Tax=Rathayibacter oskolensis TaxID=1891671 RepID=A0A1X7P1L8_9MICO|nr:PadR family transcriptional regulator [Rathayibacter oskolensis]SMH44504.1 transcriptional regulator, PadR family [Rathayibacter oskolensis]
MNSSYSTPGFGTGNPIEGIWQAMEQARSSFDKRVGSRVGRGDVRAAVLALLAEQPMHGYQIIHEIEERSGGAWKPSPGSVYPTLQLLADEGLIAADESNGRKTYTLTEAGHAQVAGSGTSAPWASAESESVDFGALPRAGVALAQAAAQVGRSGSPAQIRQAITELEDTRRRLYAILAQD